MHNSCDMVAVPRDQIVLMLEQSRLKHYWVADAIGVHKTTLRRWLNGTVKRVEACKLARLVMLLQGEDPEEML